MSPSLVRPQASPCHDLQRTLYRFQRARYQELLEAEWEQVECCELFVNVPSGRFCLARDRSPNDDELVWPPEAGVPDQ